MRFLFLCLLSVSLLSAGGAAAREIVTASAPESLSVTVYRDPERDESQRVQRNWPRGFAVISETRTVTLPAGRSTVRFDGVSEGMVAVSAIVTGLPGGTIEKNRNADLLSPASLVDGTLGNRVQISRTNPATGAVTSETAFVRTRADGGLVLETSQGFEAVRCAGIPEKLIFDGVPAGLSANPVFTIDTNDEAGGTYQITLTYLSWGFDWQAAYVARLKSGGTSGKVGLSLLSWLTVVNNNGQSFPDAELLAIAGELNIDSDYQGLSDPPTGEPLRLTCYPLGSTAEGDLIPPDNFAGRPAPAPPMAMASSIMVSGSRMERSADLAGAPLAIIAGEEELGDLKLFRVPERMNVAANGMKQVAFLNKDNVDGEFLYLAYCSPYWQYVDSDGASGLRSASLLLTMKNEEAKGLGVALPMGGVTLFEPGASGEQLVAELDMRDYAEGQDIELPLGSSTLVSVQCASTTGQPLPEAPRRWTKMRAQISNANATPVSLRLVIGQAGEWDIDWPRRSTKIKDDQAVIEVTIPANSAEIFNWKLRRPKGT